MDGFASEEMIVREDYDNLTEPYAQIPTLESALSTLVAQWSHLGVLEATYYYNIVRSLDIGHGCCFGSTLSTGSNFQLIKSAALQVSLRTIKSVINENGTAAITIDKAFERKPIRHAALNRAYGATKNDPSLHVFAFPFTRHETVGFGAMALFWKRRTTPRKNLIEELSIGVSDFHVSVKRRGLLKQLFGLTEKEIDVLRGAGVGKTSKTLSNELSIATRSVELRLQNARKKLCADNTVEAVYKALVYGVLQDNSDNNTNLLNGKYGGLE